MKELKLYEKLKEAYEITTKKYNRFKAWTRNFLAYLIIL